MKGYTPAGDCRRKELYRLYQCVALDHYTRAMSHKRFLLMSPRRKMRAIVALVAAYTVALQAAMGGAVAGPADPGAHLGAQFGSHLAARSFCLSSGQQHPGPAGQKHDCPVACAACCCGALGAPTLAATTAYENVPAGSFAVAAAIVPVWQLNVSRAHRSRAPPLG